MMINKLRIILETEQDVFRDIEIPTNYNLVKLHQVIKEAFDLKGEELASFYLSNNDWFQGSEVPLVDMSEEGGVETMDQITLEQVIPNKEDKMIYVYDFLSLWTFYIEVIETDIISVNAELPAVVFQYGKRPDTAPDNDMRIDIDTDVEDIDEDLLDMDEFTDDSYNW